MDADFYYLVCKDVCIPEQGKASLPIKIADYEVDAVWQSEINTALAATPKTGDITGAIRKSDGNVIIGLENLPASADLNSAYFFPHYQGVLSHSEPQIVKQGSRGLEIVSQADYLCLLYTSPSPRDS